MNVSQIESEYYPNDGIFDSDSERIHKLKVIVTYKLSEPERRCFLYYAECRSLRKLAKALGVSLSTANNEIKRIQAKIKRYYGT